MKKFYFISIFLAININAVFYSFVFAQNSNIDNKTDLSYKELVNKFYKNEKKKSIAIDYAKAYLDKAKKENDTIKIADGFYFMSQIHKDSIFLKYNDSIIYLTENIRIENNFYPIIGFFNKADYYYENRNFKLALTNYLKALNSEINKSNKDLIYDLKHRVGLLKSRYGNDSEALDLFKETYEYHISNRYDEQKPLYHLPVLYAFSDSHLRNHNLDSSRYYNILGYKKSIAIKDSTFINYFIFEQGLLEYELGNYKNSIDSISKSLSYISKINDLANLSYGKYYLGNSYLKLGDTIKAVTYFKKVDSIYSITNDIHPDLRDGYVKLIDFYKRRKKVKDELIYVKKLLKLDENLNNSYKKVNQNLIKDYDTPILLNEKNRLILELEKKSNSKSILLIVIISTLVIVFVMLYFQIKKKREYKIRFDNLMNKKDYNHFKNTIRKKNKSNIPQEVVQNILNHLSDFEENEGYINTNLKMDQIAKDFNTNTKYLSAVINNQKEKNFSTYINDLRIEYIINKLKINKIYRKYTIKAIAKECGFSNSESFSKAFYKKTQIYPSYFIKKLNETGLNL